MSGEYYIPYGVVLLYTSSKAVKSLHQHTTTVRRLTSSMWADVAALLEVRSRPEGSLLRSASSHSITIRQQ
jgi:hypothetical protein